MTVAVCIPYRERGQSETEVFKFVWRRWHDIPGMFVFAADDYLGNAFSQSRARNNAARCFPSWAFADVLIFAQADTTFLDPKDIEEAVEIARQGGWVLPAEYLMADEAWTADLVKGASLPARLAVPDKEECHEIRRGQGGCQCEKPHLMYDSPAGIQIVSREAFETVNGWDESFIGWGWEDAAFRDAMDTLVTTHTRLGTAVHLWHPRGEWHSPNGREGRANRQRWKQYQAAARRGPDAMRKLVAS